MASKLKACCCRSGSVQPMETASTGPSGAPARKCGDVLCLLFFALFWVGMAVVAAVGFRSGDPQRLLYGTDYTGATCGASGGAGALVFYPRLSQDLRDAASAGTSPLDVVLYGVCVPACPAPGGYVCTYEAEAAIASGAEARSRAALSDDPLLQRGPCWHVGLPTEPVLRRCMPRDDTNSTSTSRCRKPGGGYYSAAVATEARYYSADGATASALCDAVEVTTTAVRTHAAGPNPLLDRLRQAGALLGRWTGDVRKSWLPVLAVCGGGAMAASLLWVLALRLAAGFMVWFTLWAVVLAFAALAGLCAFKAGSLGTASLGGSSAMLGGGSAAEQEGANKAYFEAAAYVLAGLSLVLLGGMLVLRHKVRVAVGILRQAAAVLRSLPVLALFPLLPYAALFGLLAYWLVAGAYVASLEGVTAADVAALASSAVGAALPGLAVNGTNSTLLPPSQVKQAMLAYHFFGLLWTSQLIQAVATCTVAGATCRWYWTRDKSASGYGRFPVASALKNCFRYHLGSLAFGALVVALAQFARAALGYLDKNTKGLQQRSRCLAAAMKVVKCCMWCLEKVLKFVSRNAYIMIAMKGSSFCAATKEAFQLLFANLAQIGVIAAVSGALLLLAKATVTVASTAVLFAVIDGDAAFARGGASELSSPFVPVFVGAIFAYFVASTFLGLFEGVVDTVMLCFCEDLRVNEEGRYFMSEELQRVLGVHPGKVQKDQHGGGGETEGGKFHGW